jgi:hypothetical protein
METFKGTLKIFFIFYGQNRQLIPYSSDGDGKVMMTPLTSIAFIVSCPPDDER